MIINKTTYEVQTMSSHPDDNWMGGDWAIVPETLHKKAEAFTPYCILVWSGDALVDILESGTRPPVPEPEPSADELLNLLLGVENND